MLKTNFRIYFENIVLHCIAKQSISIFQTEAHSSRERPQSSSVSSCIGVCICICIFICIFICLNQTGHLYMFDFTIYILYAVMPQPCLGGHGSDFFYVGRKIYVFFCFFFSFFKFPTWEISEEINIYTCLNNIILL